MSGMRGVWIVVASLLFLCGEVRAMIIDVPEPDYHNATIQTLDFRNAEFEEVLSTLLKIVNDVSDEPVSLLLVEDGNHHLTSATNALDKGVLSSIFDPVTLSLPKCQIRDAFAYCSEMANPDMHIYYEFGLIIISDRYIQNRDPYVVRYSSSASKHYIRCDHCKSYVLGLRELYSGNTYGAKFWTDGKRDAPMLPYTNQLIKCPYCGDLFWPKLFIPVETSRTKPDEEDYFVYLSQYCPDDSDKEAYVRTRYWWAYNDRYRTGIKTYQLGEFEENNLRVLLSLMSVSNEYERIQSAEIYRELGEFDKSLELLKIDFSEEVTESARQIRALSEQKVKRVKELNFD